MFPKIRADRDHLDDICNHIYRVCVFWSYMACMYCMYEYLFVIARHSHMLCIKIVLLVQIMIDDEIVIVISECVFYSLYI